LGDTLAGEPRFAIALGLAKQNFGFILKAFVRNNLGKSMKNLRYSQSVLMNRGYFTVLLLMNRGYFTDEPGILYCPSTDEPGILY
jgi:hypothetical protein